MNHGCYARRDERQLVSLTGVTAQAVATTMALVTLGLRGDVAAISSMAPTPAVVSIDPLHGTPNPERTRIVTLPVTIPAKRHK